MIDMAAHTAQLRLGAVGLGLKARHDKVLNSLSGLGAVASQVLVGAAIVGESEDLALLGADRYLLNKFGSLQAVVDAGSGDSSSAEGNDSGDLHLDVYKDGY